MTARLAAIRRHPIKAHGREALDHVTLEAGHTLPWDRHWAVAHSAARLDGPGWAPCANFTRGAKSPQLMAITATFEEPTRTVVLRHPERPVLRFAPDHDEAAFLDWVAPLVPPGRPPPDRIVRAGARGMTDTDFPSISLNSLSALAELGARCGKTLSPERFRGNLWIEGLAPWAELGWVGRTVAVGAARIEIREPIERCRATDADPASGRRDTDILAALEAGWQHSAFGVYGVVVTGGPIAVGDAVRPV